MEPTPTPQPKPPRPPSKYPISCLAIPLVLCMMGLVALFSIASKQPDKNAVPPTPPAGRRDKPGELDLIKIINDETVSDTDALRQLAEGLDFYDVRIGRDG